MMNEQRDHITDALYKDLKQTPFLVAFSFLLGDARSEPDCNPHPIAERLCVACCQANLAELDGVVKEAQLAIDSLDDWNKPEHKSVPLPVLPAKA